MNRWILWAGLGLVRFGMEMFEEAIKKLGGPKLRLILQKYTDKGWKAVTTGTIITGILNSSTLISLLTLWFVSTGMMALVNAVGVLVGANIGSTATWLIVWFLWFGEFKISAFALPLIAIGWVIMLVTSSKYRWYWAKLLIGFGLFFLWIDFLKDNMDVMAKVFDFGQYKDMNLWIFGIIGMIITALVQSSGAVGVMTLAALSSQIITFEAWFAIILWANIGTTFTALIASLSGSTAKRQIGIANVLFNVITVIIGVIFFYPYIWLTLEYLGYKSNPVIGNAIINFIFNFTTSLAFVPFLKPFTRLITWVIPHKDEHYDLDILQHPLALDEQKYDTDTASVALDALDVDKKYLTRQALEYISMIWGIDSSRIEHDEPQASIIDNLIKFDNELHRAMYTKVKQQLDLIFAYIQSLQSKELTSDDRQELDNYTLSFISLSNAIKATENIRENISTLREALDPHLRTLYYELLDIVISLNKAVYTSIGRTPLKVPCTIDTVVDAMILYRNNLLTHISPYVIKGNVGDMDVSSLVNMTGELVDCVKDMEKSLD